MKVEIEERAVTVYGSKEVDGPSIAMPRMGYVFTFRGHELACVMPGPGWWVLICTRDGLALMEPQMASLGALHLIFAFFKMPSHLLDFYEKGLSDAAKVDVDQLRANGGASRRQDFKNIFHRERN